MAAASVLVLALRALCIIGVMSLSYFSSSSNQSAVNQHINTSSIVAVDVTLHSCTNAAVVVVA